MLIVIAANAPSFFPEWWQASVYSFGLGAGIFAIAYAYHVSLLKDDLDRKDDTIKELKEQLRIETKTAKIDSSNAINEIPGNKDKSVSNLKAMAFKHSELIQTILSERENQLTSISDELKKKTNRRQLESNLFINELLMTRAEKAVLSIHRELTERKKEQINEDTICRYLICHKVTKALRQELWVKAPPGSEGEKAVLYQHPITIDKIQRIAEDLEKLANQLEE